MYVGEIIYNETKKRDKHLVMCILIFNKLNN